MLKIPADARTNKTTQQAKLFATKYFTMARFVKLCNLQQIRILLSKLLKYQKV